MLVKYGFKRGLIESVGGWQCYITNVIKEADYPQTWRDKSQPARDHAAEIWSRVLFWELERSKPRLVVIMRTTYTKLLIKPLVDKRLIDVPDQKVITHYAYIGLCAQGTLGTDASRPIMAYDQEFTCIRNVFDALSKPVNGPQFLAYTPRNGNLPLHDWKVNRGVHVDSHTYRE